MGGESTGSRQLEQNIDSSGRNISENTTENKTENGMSVSKKDKMRDITQEIENKIEKIKKGDIIEIKYKRQGKKENPILVVRSKIYNSKYRVILGSGASEIKPYGAIKKENQFYIVKEGDEGKEYPIESIKIL